MAGLIDKMAEAIHDVWWNQALDRGDTFGPRGRKGCHPHVGPWNAKTEQERMQDRYIAIEVVRRLRADPQAGEAIIADVIHTAIRNCRYAETGGVPDYLAGVWDADERSRRERGAQAEAVLRIWKSNFGN